MCCTLRCYINDDGLFLTNLQPIDYRHLVLIKLNFTNSFMIRSTLVRLGGLYSCLNPILDLQHQVS